MDARGIRVKNNIISLSTVEVFNLCNATFCLTTEGSSAQFHYLSRFIERAKSEEVKTPETDKDDLDGGSQYILFFILQVVFYKMKEVSPSNFPDNSLSN